MDAAYYAIDVQISSPLIKKVGVPLPLLIYGCKLLLMVQPEDLKRLPRFQQVGL
jgi:hypothetical protein